MLVSVLVSVPVSVSVQVLVLFLVLFRFIVSLSLLYLVASIQFNAFQTTRLTLLPPPHNEECLRAVHL